jgi:hypothetical protein
MNKSLLLRALRSFGQLQVPAAKRAAVNNCWNCGNPHHSTCCRRSREATEHAQALATRNAVPTI